MRAALFPDNTVLVNLAHVHRVGLLGDLFPTRQWCASVAQECTQSANVPGLDDLGNAQAIFGAPLYPDRAEHEDTIVFRDRMAKPGDGPTKHLGEAETVAIVSRRKIDAVFVTDDGDATKLARFHGVKVITTWRVFQLAHKIGLLTPDEVWADCQTLHAAQRGWPPCGRNRAGFDAWLAI